MKEIIRLLAGCFVCFLSLGVSAENWPQWRGPFLNGSTTETNLPSTWSKTENVLWSTPLPGTGHATPIIWDDSVFVTSPDEDENLLLFCLDRHTGKIRWQKQVAVGNRVAGRNNMASPSPVTDGKTVWVMFGTGDLAAFDFSGHPLWARNLATEYGKFVINWLYGSSPMLYHGRLYVEVLHRNPASYILCLDPQTGTNIWRHIRLTDAKAESQEAYSTPMPSETARGTEIIIVGGDYVTGQDAKTGEEWWRGGGLRNFQHLGDARLVPSPVVAEGMVIVSGAKRNPLLAFHDGGQRDITSSGLAWSYKKYPTDCVTPLFYQGKLFVLDGDRQIMSCLDPKTGEAAWQKPMGLREIFRASPTGADGKIYCLTEDATAVVLSAADGAVLSTVRMEEGRTHATIAAAQGCLFVRTASHLYCIGK
ncbi:MAG TPA: PQQ-binding-like beta-propeller repeat protein [Candidatus Saccharimonadales bacterium]|nr:PQQ-binding-like beta-propeller repeat protein [Candidatus Saccharimonadales bacterium]